MTDTDVRYRKYLAEGIDKEPETVLEALIAARAILTEEGRWMTGVWFQNNHPEVNPEDPFCNSWAVCAEGAVGLVTVGVKPMVYFQGHVPTPEDATFFFDEADASDSKLYEDTNEALRSAAARILFEQDAWNINSWSEDALVETYGYSDPAEAYEANVEAAHQYNDDSCGTRTQAIAWFDYAIKVEEARTNA